MAGSGGAGGIEFKEGTIELSENPYTISTMTYFNSSMSAAFMKISVASSTITGCTQVTSGACTIKHCNAPVPFSIDWVNAGTIAIDGTRMSGGVSLNPPMAPSKTYFQAVPSALWNPGDRLTVSASGGEVPSFAGQSVTAPSTITVTEPSCSTGACTLDRAASLHVAWAGGTAGQVHVKIVTHTSSILSTAVDCIYDANLGSATIDASVMGQLDAVPAMSGSLDITSEFATTFNAGEYSIVFRAKSSGLTAQATTN
jgi:hypothetical protein